VPEFEIRPATLADLDALVELRLAVQAHSERSSSAVWRMTPEAKARAGDELAEQIASSDALVVMACGAGGEPIGMAVGQVQRQEKYEPNVSGMIRRVYVSEGWRRRGVGQAMIRGLLGFFREKGVEKLTLRYIPGNMEAEGFWSSLGFRTSLIQADAKRSVVAELVGVDEDNLDSY